MQLAPRIHRLGDGRINADLIADGTEVTNIDAGVPGHWGELPGEPAAMERALDIRGAAIDRVPEPPR